MGLKMSFGKGNMYSASIFAILNLQSSSSLGLSMFLLDDAARVRDTEAFRVLQQHERN